MGFSDPNGAADLLRRGRARHAPVAVYPQLVECAAPMTARDNPEFHYDFGVSLFIAGIGAMAANRPAQDAAS